MAEKEKMEKAKANTKDKDAKNENVACEDKCNIHGTLSVRGRKFEGTIIKLVGQRAVIEWERIIYFPKYERYARTRSRLHAHIPKCMLSDVKLGDYVEVGECRPISKITHFVLLRRIR